MVECENSVAFPKVSKDLFIVRYKQNSGDVFFTEEGHWFKWLTSTRV